MPELYPEALKVTRQIWSKSERAEALIKLAEQMPELYSEALKLVRQIQDESEELIDPKIIVALAEKIPPKLYPEVLDITRQIDEYEPERGAVFITLAEKLPELRSEVLKLITDQAYDMYFLEALEEKLPAVLVPKVLEIVVASQIQDGSYSSDFLSALLKRLQNHDVDWPFWFKLNNLVTCRVRNEYILNLSLLAPAIITLGGEEALRRIWEAMREVCGWWP